ncbi:hypothetical protein NEOKW01_1101 [Nematocida sp. AWRm80]|nr:hypothetical protein NEOKW01_1101 [Nematocida sp. AWRm80]
MAKSKNHTNQNQNRKHHRNGIHKPKEWQLLPRVGMPTEQRETLKREMTEKYSIGIKKRMTFEERQKLANENPKIQRRNLIKKIGIRKMALNGIYLN